MAINYVTIKAQIKDGKLVNPELPENVVDGEVELQVPVATEVQAAQTVDDAPLTDDEIDALMRPHPKSGAEIAQNPAIGSWANKGITDSVEWVQEQRRKRRGKRGW
jgi:hypothetical protein